MISLLGCFTISVLSFVLPPLIHINLISIPALQRVLSEGGVGGDSSDPRGFGATGRSLFSDDEAADSSSASNDRPRAGFPALDRKLSMSPIKTSLWEDEQTSRVNSARIQYYCDALLVAGGIFVCILGTALTSIDIFHKVAAGGAC